MSRGRSSAAAFREGLSLESPILAGDGFDVFEGWGSLSPDQLAACEQAEAEMREGRIAGVPHAEVQRRLAEARASSNG